MCSYFVFFEAWVRELGRKDEVQGSGRKTIVLKFEKSKNEKSKSEKVSF
jgi:hypothetical protein